MRKYFPTATDVRARGCLDANAVLCQLMPFGPPLQDEIQDRTTQFEANVVKS